MSYNINISNFILTELLEVLKYFLQKEINL